MEFNLEAYLREMAEFQGKLNIMANSIELSLKTIIETLGLPRKKYMRQMVSTLENNIQLLPQDCVDDYLRLFDDIREFNGVWIIAKHGMPVGGRAVLTILKDDEFHEFYPDRIEEINSSFTRIMNSLTEVVNKTKRLT